MEQDLGVDSRPQPCWENYPKNIKNLNLLPHKRRESTITRHWSSNTKNWDSWTTKVMNLRHPKSRWTVTRALWEDLSTRLPEVSSRDISERASFSRNLLGTSLKFTPDLFQNSLRIKMVNSQEPSLTRRLTMLMKDSLRGKIKTRSHITSIKTSNKWC